MSLKNIHLRKVLKAFGLPENKLISLLRDDIRQDIAKASGKQDGGGDFHGPFWSDAKDFVLYGKDLDLQTQSRIDANYRRRRLYPQLRDGFMDWWNNKRRFSNEKIEPYTTAMKSRFNVEGIDATIKVENLLGVSVGEDGNRLIYPYFSESPKLSEDNARIGLWLISQAFPNHRIEDFRILDVLRGNTFSVESHPFNGREQRDFYYHMNRLVEKWEKLKGEY